MKREETGFIGEDIVTPPHSDPSSWISKIKKQQRRKENRKRNKMRRKKIGCSSCCPRIFES